MKFKWNNQWMAAAGIAVVTVGLFGFKGDERNFRISKNLDIFNTAFRELDLFYVDTLNPEKVISTGLRAMLEQLDPYTVYYSEDQAEELKMMTTGKYAGIGSVIRFHKGCNHVVIAEPYEHMPASEVGLKAGDILLEINGKDLTGSAVSAVSDLLRGEAGTSFLLKYQRPGNTQPTEVRIERRNIQTPAVPYYGMADATTGYILLNSFTENCSRDVRRALIDLKQQGAKALVLDLRGNGGGLMNEAVEIVNLFVDKGVEVLSTKGKLKQANSTNKTTKEPLDTEMPLVVLVNGDSASASEIVAGSLQDLDRAVIIGERTYGKGLVQAIRDLPYNGSMKVTTSKYYIPSGRCVQAINYSKRDASGRPERIPDSLTTVFHTKMGREVRDGGGITPDVKIEEEKLPTLLYYLSNSDELFDFATEFCSKHPQVASAQEFSIDDETYTAFKQYMKNSKFSYDKESERALKKLRDLAEMEGYLEGAQEEFKALEKKLTPQLEQDLEHFSKEVKMLLADEIIKRYYFQRGAIIQQLKDDQGLKEAQRVLSDEAEYRNILAPQLAATSKK